MLAEWLHQYAKDKGDSHWRPRKPDKHILAQCLAIAPVDTLVNILRELYSDNKRGMTSYAWFVAVFRQRLQGDSPPAPLTPEPKPVSKISGEESYTRDLVERAKTGVKSIRR